LQAGAQECFAVVAAGGADITATFIHKVTTMTHRDDSRGSGYPTTEYPFLSTPEQLCARGECADPIPDLSFIPTTAHQAYCAGHDAARRGEDLVMVVHAALRTWPMDEGLAELAELITSASYGYHTAEGGAR
jgi:hypothetical protein